MLTVELTELPERKEFDPQYRRAPNRGYYLDRHDTLVALLSAQAVQFPGVTMDHLDPGTVGTGFDPGQAFVSAVRNDSQPGNIRRRRLQGRRHRVDTD